MRARVKYTIETIIKHCEDNYPGVIYCWDVVNEAVDGSVGDSSNYNIKLFYNDFSTFNSTKCTYICNLIN